MVKERKDIPEKYKWNIEAMYKDSAACEKDLQKALGMAEAFEKYNGHLADSAKTLADALKEKDEIWKLAENALVYAHMKKDEDGRAAESQALSGKASAVVSQMAQSMSFFAPQMAEISDETLKAWLKEEAGLKPYAHLLDQFIREKAHILSDDQEKLLAALSELTDSNEEAFNMLNDADFSFGTIKNEKGEDVEVTHGSYISLMKSTDRRVREDAYSNMYKVYKQFGNSLATLYNYNVKQDVIYSRIRNYESSRAAALYGDDIPESVYDNLIDTVNKHLPALHKYVGLRKKLMGYDSLKMSDMYAPILPRAERNVSYEEAQEIIFKALKPLGKEYLDTLKKGFESRWADVYENPGKHSGAYSFGSYSSMPYVLLNYDGKLEDVFTVIHEMGHSMHSSYTRANQPYVYGDHSIFTAEVASTVNEALLTRYLVANAEDKAEKAMLINDWLEAFRTTLFRQTQFAEFEMETHKLVESGETLTSELLQDLYGKLNAKYYGEAVDYDDMIPAEWSRIPHFYRAFYVYQYATGYSAATAISSKILEEGDSAAADYIEFLKSGSSDYPIELLKIAGVDMSSPAPVEAAMKRFEELVDELAELVQ